MDVVILTLLLSSDHMTLCKLMVAKIFLHCGDGCWAIFIEPPKNPVVAFYILCVILIVVNESWLVFELIVFLPKKKVNSYQMFSE